MRLVRQCGGNDRRGPPAQHVGIPGRKCLSHPTSGLATTQRWTAA